MNDGDLFTFIERFWFVQGLSFDIYSPGSSDRAHLQSTATAEPFHTSTDLSATALVPSSGNDSSVIYLLLLFAVGSIVIISLFLKPSAYSICARLFTVQVMHKSVCQRAGGFGTSEAYRYAHPVYQFLLSKWLTVMLCDDCGLRHGLCFCLMSQVGFHISNPCALNRRPLHAGLSCMSPQGYGFHAFYLYFCAFDQLGSQGSNVIVCIF